MRKLMTAVAAASTSLFAFGAVGDFTHTGFEASPYVAGEVLDTQKDDAGLKDGQTDFAKVWEGYDAGTNASTVVKAYDNDAPAIDGKTAGSNYLYVETDEAPVTRYVKQGAAAETISSKGIYLDTLVKFTPMDAEDGTSLETTEGDKIAIALVGDETKGTTNFVVRAGYVEGSSITPTNYTMNAVAENFDYSDWHRLIVEAISDVGNANAPVGFVVYVDGTMLTYSTDVAAGDAAYVDSFNGVVKENLYNSSKHALLPSLVDANAATCGTLASVSFKGQGSVDDIEFTATRPTVIPNFGTIVTIEWDDGVETVKIGTDEAFATDGLGYTSTNITVDADVTSLAVEATPADGKEIGEWTASAGTFANGAWTGFASGATLTITSMTPLFKVGDKNYGNFTAALNDAVAAAAQSGSPATIQLLADYTGDITFEEGDIILDLAGNTLTGSDTATIMNIGANLLITNSTATVGHIDPGTLDYAILISSGLTQIYAGYVDGMIEFDTEEDTTKLLELYGGYYVDVNSATTVEDFYRKEYAKATVTYTGSDYYFLIGDNSEPEPKEIDVPTAVSGLVYDGTVLTGVEEGTGYTLSGNTATDAGNYTATATLADGYVWTGGSTAAQTINWSIAAKTDATVVVTLTSEIAEYSAQLEFPTASATIGNGVVEGTPTWNPAEITEPNAGETNTYTVTFTVTTANYAESTGTAEFKVWKAAGGGGGDWPADPTEVSGQTAADAFGITGDLATADAGVLATWAKAKGVDYSDRTTEILTDAFLLDCANTQEAIDAAKANFKVTSITVVGDMVTITPTDAADYGNGQIVIEGATAITSPMSWHPKTTGDHFFRATLVVKPVTP